MTAPGAEGCGSMKLIGKVRLLPQSRTSDTWLWHVRSQQARMNCARLRLNAETTTIFVRDGWLIIEAAEADALRERMAGADGDRLVTVAEVSERTGFTAGAVRDWIKRSERNTAFVKLTSQSCSTATRRKPSQSRSESGADERLCRCERQC
jgi:hypothetical protein